MKNDILGVQSETKSTTSARCLWLRYAGKQLRRGVLVALGLVVVPVAFTGEYEDVLYTDSLSTEALEVAHAADRAFLFYRSGGDQDEYQAQIYVKLPEAETQELLQLAAEIQEVPPDMREPKKAASEQAGQGLKVGIVVESGPFAYHIALDDIAAQRESSERLSAVYMLEPTLHRRLCELASAERNRELIDNAVKQSNAQLMREKENALATARNAERVRVVLSLRQHRVYLPFVPSAADAHELLELVSKIQLAPAECVVQNSVLESPEGAIAQIGLELVSRGGSVVLDMSEIRLASRCHDLDQRPLMLEDVAWARLNDKCHLLLWNNVWTFNLLTRLFAFDRMVP